MAKHDLKLRITDVDKNELTACVCERIYFFSYTWSRTISSIMVHKNPTSFSFPWRPSLHASISMTSQYSCSRNRETSTAHSQDGSKFLSRTTIPHPRAQQRKTECGDDDDIWMCSLDFCTRYHLYFIFYWFLHPNRHPQMKRDCWDTFTEYIA